MDHFILGEDRETVAVDMMTWAKWFETANRTVAKTVVVPAKVEVSTVFLGLDHSFGCGPPLFYETMVFGGDCDGQIDRYTTWEEAETGHVVMVAQIKERIAGLNVEQFPLRKARKH